jgi:hypothetical protein
VSFSEDQASPTTPFLGDTTGEVFDTPDPDVILQSPMTAERVVDTQSGFLVVVRNLESRLALSVKRRLGTPPTSTLLLTPDESLKLSRILNASDAPATIASSISDQFRAEALAANIEDCLSGLTEQTAESKPAVPTGEVEAAAFSKSNGDREPRLHRTDLSRLLDTEAKLTIAQNNKRIAIIMVGLVAALVAIYFVTHKSIKRHVANQPAVTSQINEQALLEKRIDTFVRNYVSNMLDFSPSSYRYSQIQAMAAMSPALADKYWKETHFPIAAPQLKSIQKRETLLITKVVQEVLPNQAGRAVDVYAELNSPTSKVITPVHLTLTLATTQPNGEIQVLEQKDLTSQAK